MKFSICIPNYNYERYLGSTIQSILDQDYQDLEVLVSDNASTDGSQALVRGIGDPRVQLHVNTCNVGFAGNLDRSARMASGDTMIMLSSDDQMRPGALSTYAKLIECLGSRAQKVIASSSWDIIDAQDAVIDQTGPDRTLWLEADRQPAAEQTLGCAVYGVAGREMLRRCLQQMKNPFNFAATMYATQLYRQVEGYGGGRLFNPDKWFHWRVLAEADMAYWVDRRLFAYRWHTSNQVSQEGAIGALKFLVDEYVSTLELDRGLLEQIGLSRDDVTDAFIEHDIGRHGLATLARGQRVRARQILDFGRATYPNHLRRNRKVLALRALLALGPVGQRVARRAYRSYQRASSSHDGQ
ncbi:MAG: glycosyltransferase family 2 protein [Pirellulales bacterium]